MNLRDLSATKTLDLINSLSCNQCPIVQSALVQAVVAVLQSITGNVIFFSKLGLGSLCHTLNIHVYVSVLYRLELAKKVCALATQLASVGFVQLATPSCNN